MCGICAASGGAGGNVGRGSDERCCEVPELRRRAARLGRQGLEGLSDGSYTIDTLPT